MESSSLKQKVLLADWLIQCLNLFMSMLSWVTRPYSAVLAAGDDVSDETMPPSQKQHDGKYCVLMKTSGFEAAPRDFLTIKAGGRMRMLFLLLD